MGIKFRARSNKMSRPATRNKNKKKNSDDKVGTSSDVLRKIHLTGEISPDDICQLYCILKPVCQGCRVNSKDSPNCFCGLIPPSNGIRKSGLWQKMSDIVNVLGTDPSKNLRASMKLPAGLTNLGATCYANSILQCLYMTTSFRAGIFSVEPELLSQSPMLYQLSRLFGQLHSSKQSFIDSAPFIKTLELDNGVQQDSHEFLTLFLSLLERSLSRSKFPKSRTIVQDLFRGSMSHVTRCSMCGKDSEASSQMEDFYELEMNIKDVNSLGESLDDYFSLEELKDDNQYFCESCSTQVDATRRIKLRALPTILNFQLKRYLFIHKTTTKKKITSSFSFPKYLEMEKWFPEATNSNLIYELSAILIHKGSTVNSGHYVAHIKDGSGIWWEFDDEDVSELGLHPFGKGTMSSTATAEPEAEKNYSGQVDASLGGNPDLTLLPSSLSSTQTEMFSSTDAYLLMYNRTSGLKCSDKFLRTNDSVLDEKVCEDFSDTLPSYLCEEINKLNASLITLCHEYLEKKTKKVEKVTARRQEVRTVLSEAPVSSPDDPYFWISTDWLRQWADSIVPSCIDNKTLQCPHHKVPVSKIGSMKRISESAWKTLLKKYGGGPELFRDDYCIECIKDVVKTTMCSKDYRERRSLMKEIAEAALGGTSVGGNLYYVSRSWLLHWLRRKNIDSPCEVDAEPTASLKCSHGRLLPEHAPGAKRVLIPENLWLFFLESARTVEPSDASGYSTFSSDAEICATCFQELTQVAFMENNLRDWKIKQRNNHEKLYLGKCPSLSPGVKYYLLPSYWLAQWRTYVTTSGKNSSQSVEPESLAVVIDSLTCEKHSLLLERPPQLICKRGAILQKAPSTDALTLVTENDWRTFCEEWKVDIDKGFSALIDHFQEINKVAGSCEEMQLPEELLNSNGDSIFPQPTINTHPGACEECIGERESCALVQKLNYSDEDICVFLVRGKEVPKYIVEASDAIYEPDRRMSKRSRRTSFGNSLNLKVSGSTTVYELKMMLWESFGIVKENQKLYKGTKEIDNESATLADMNIFPRDVLWVTDTEIYENRDIADELSGHKMHGPEAEEGFRGTLLTSHVLQQNQ